MQILDNFITDKLLHSIATLIRQEGIDEILNPITALIRFLTISEYFGDEIFEIYTEHYRRIFTILEILAAKQGLDTNRQVFNLVRHYINRTNIKLTITDLVNIYRFHICRTIISTPEIIGTSGIGIIIKK